MVNDGSDEGCGQSGSELGDEQGEARGRPLDGGAEATELCRGIGPTDELPLCVYKCSGGGQACGNSCGTGTPPMPESDIPSMMKTIAEGWTRQGDSIVRELACLDRLVAAKLAARLVLEFAKLAQSLGHDAEVRVCFCKITIILTTHSAGNMLTQLDFTFAQRADVAISALIASAGE
ncbi:MAG: 4a-hydroxytetrahydrobiopterin dehydratase [Patescibacteria group bacterium]